MYVWYSINICTAYRTGSSGGHHEDQRPLRGEIAATGKAESNAGQD